MSSPENNGFKNFTPRAKQVLLLARREAERLNHNFVGTEHLLLGLIALNEGVAVQVLNSMGLNLNKLRLEVEKCCGSGGETQTSGELPLTSCLQTVLAGAQQDVGEDRDGVAPLHHPVHVAERSEKGRALDSDSHR